jgi:hypothetical protein
MSGIFGAILGGILLMSYMGKELSDGHAAPGDIKLFDISQVFGYIGITIFVFEGNGVVINLRSEAQNKKAYPLILKMAVLSIVVWYMSLSTVSYITYKNTIKDFITESLPITAFTIFIHICISYNALTSYPI